MGSLSDSIALIKAVASNAQIIRARPSVNWFLLKYMGKFRVQNVDQRLVVHSHLPPVNSGAFTRFINEHLLNRTHGPSHAQIGLTNACPQNCQYCYNKNRSGKLLTTPEIKHLIQELKTMGVFWLGFTGGEPLLNKDIVEIISSAGADCATKLFTTGVNLTHELAAQLKKAGLLYVSVSLDHWLEEEHDRVRGYKGAFRTALSAIEMFKRVGMHVSVSSVLSREMLREDAVERFLRFLIGLEVHEAWLSETKPTVEAFWNKDSVITEDERLALVRLQDRYNRAGQITVNYLGHFEGGEHFGCNAGNKMVYIDSFGEVSPCVFTPVTFGNVRDRQIASIVAEMRDHFPSEGCCFINKNYELIRRHYSGRFPISREDTLDMMKEVEFGPPSVFLRLHKNQ